MLYGTGDDFDDDVLDRDEPSDMWDDVAADANTLASAGFGTDEDYGYYGDGLDFGE